jgi:hypothetical protein
MYERKSTAAVTAGISGAPPAAVVGDGDGDMAVGDDSVQPDETWCAVRDEGMLGGVSEGFMHRKRGGRPAGPPPLPPPDAGTALEIDRTGGRGGIISLGNRQLLAAEILAAAGSASASRTPR